MGSKKKSRESILESPALRTLFSSVLPILAGVLSGTFVFEITAPHGLAWGGFYKAASFWGLVAVGLVAYRYNRALYVYDRDVERFQDDDYCSAYMRSKCLPEAAERYKELIRDGNGADFDKAMEELWRRFR